MITQIPKFRTRQKPPRGSLINWNHPAALGLGFYCNFDGFSPTPGSTGRQTAQDKVSGARQVAGTVNVISAHFWDLGVAAHFGTATNDGFIFGAAATVGNCPDIAGWIGLGSSGNFTSACKIRVKNAGTSARHALGQNSSSATAQWALGMSAAEKWIFNIADDAASPVSVATYNDGNWYTLFGVNIIVAAPGASLPTLYVFDAGGALLETITANLVGINPATSGTLQPISIGCTGDTGGGAIDGQIEWCAIWKRELDIGEIRKLASDPYQILNQGKQMNWAGFYNKNAVVSSRRRVHIA